MRQWIAILTVAALAGACSSGTGPPGPTATPTDTPSPGTATPGPTPLPEWPFTYVACEGSPGEPMVVVALGTSETAGWGILSSEPYSPQAAYPAVYVDILCKELGVPVELRSYYPSQQGNERAPLAWWIEKLNADLRIRLDLGAADIVSLWAMSSHDILAALVLPGSCGGDWPDPRRACLEGRTARIPSETDELFGLVGDLVPDGAVVLAGDAYVPPGMFEMSWVDEPYRDEIKRMIDPYFSVEPMAARHGFVFVDTEVVFNGVSRWEPPANGLFQSDGLHPTAAGARLTAETYAGADGLGD